MDTEKKKKIEIVSGNVNDLNISPVYDHINIEKPKDVKKKKKIIIPNDKNGRKWEMGIVLISEYIGKFV